MTKKILIIEDEVTLQKALAEFLKEEGFEVVSAADGEKGIALAKSENPDLILLDIIIPRKDGFEVLDEIKRDEKTKNIPVILLTNLESAEDVDKAVARGASAFLVKSEYKMEEIVAKIKETLKM